MSFSSNVKLYVEVAKLKIVYLLVFTAFASMIVCSGPTIPWVTIGIIVLAVSLGSSGANVLTGYLDRDIDAIMNRTKNRPIPSGRISPNKALSYGLTLSSLSLILSFYINPLSALFMFIGLFDNVIIYSKILKRRNPSNIILGGISGGMPILVGYAALPSPEKSWIAAGLMAVLVILWIPPHIWSLALHSKEDYKLAKVPMLPVIISERTSVRIISITSMITVFFSILLYYVGIFGLIYLITASILGLIIMLYSFILILDPSEEKAWKFFKFSSPYLALLFIGMIVDFLI
tara:strand:+ start:67 stop:936 length:870 start_codon:yes stop_codon:yes gene_type:complete